jgi:hypothetical protein
MPLSLKGRPGHGRVRRRGRTKGRENRGVGGRQAPREEIDSRTAVKLLSREKSVETNKIYIEPCREDLGGFIYQI